MVRIAVTTPCMRCLKPTPAIAKEIINWGDLQYQLQLCQRHHMQLEKEIRSWTNLGMLVDETEAAPVRRPIADEEQSRPPRYHTPQRAEQLEVPIFDGGVEEEEDIALWRDKLPQEAKALASIPELTDWRLSRKAREQAGKVSIDILPAMMTAAMPESVERCVDGDPDIELHARGSIYALVSLSTKTVITVFRRGESRVGANGRPAMARL